MTSIDVIREQGEAAVLFFLLLFFRKKGTESPDLPEIKKRKPREGPSQKF